jgi:hypothetical protein
MAATDHITMFINSEAASMLHRLKQVKPFSMTMTMVKSAAVSDAAFAGVNLHLEEKRNKLMRSVLSFLRYTESHRNTAINVSTLQNRFAALKLRFNNILDQLDIYADALAQRSEPETGTWLRGLDLLAHDGLRCGKKFYEIPPLMVYLDRGHGAAIRRARTRLPGGDENPVAVIQIPRERMVGNGIASSLIHEAGHQGAELIGLTKALKEATAQEGAKKTRNQRAWIYFERWVSEIVADFWAIAQLGVTATLGLMGVMTLPSYFQFRLDLEDPHPAPYVRVMLNCCIGAILFPDAQWKKLEEMWKQFYPTAGLPEQKQQDIAALNEEMPAFIRLMINLRLAALNKKRLIEIFPVAERQPRMLREVYEAALINRSLFKRMTPMEFFAVIGQAKADHRITAHAESHLLQTQLTRWANQSCINFKNKQSYGSQRD